MRYDAVIIGAGMSGLACAIRLGMYGKKVLVLEQHRIAGGLNSFYQRGKRKMDVGLHAMTNYVGRNQRKAPLNKLLKQLRIPYDAFALVPQKQSLIHFPQHRLHFNNSIGMLIEEIEREFPQEKDNFLKLVEFVGQFNDVDLYQKQQSARGMLEHMLRDKQLIEMILCPLMIYGSAWERDMDLAQFVIMFKSIFLEGFARPSGGVRTVIDILLEKCDKAGVDISFGEGVENIVLDKDKVKGVMTNKGKFIDAKKVFSSAGLPETNNLLANARLRSKTGAMTFTECLFYTPEKPVSWGAEDTIIFYNETSNYIYERPETPIDKRSAVICYPNNYEKDELDEGLVRITHMADYNYWQRITVENGKKFYREKKKEIIENHGLGLLEKIHPNFSRESVIFTDSFTPKTVEHYTGHARGTIYGSPDKSRDGRTGIEGLNIIGTDQGFLGIVGAMLSGISMANLHGLMETT